MLIPAFAILSLHFSTFPSPAGETLFTIDARATHSISRYIYGTNFPDWKKMPGVTFARMGGNRLTAYNWETNASNAGNDYHYQNDGYMGATDEAGWSEGSFLKENQSHGAAVLLTIPTAGWVSADKKGDGDLTQAPGYLEKRFFRSYAKKPGGNYTYPPDTTDRAVYQDEFVAWLEKTKSPGANLWYSLDNEPDLWASTHKEIVAKPVTYAGIIANNVEFGSAIKSVAPKALVFGPANYGWQGFRTFQNAPDANGRDFLDAYLDGMRAAEKTTGKRILDVLDIHWYPEAQGDGVRIAFAGDKPGANAARIQAPRSLWDPTYVEQSWIADTLGKEPIVLLPGILKQIETHYPGTKFAITEYNYGGGKVISGAIAEADVLGQFGKYGLFAASVFGMNSDDSAQIAGLRAFTDFDGKGGRFGDLGLDVMGGHADSDSVYAALDTKDKARLTLVVINKTGIASPVNLSVRGFSATSAKVYTVSETSLPKHVPGEAMVRDGSIHFVSPAYSVTTIEARR